MTSRRTNPVAPRVLITGCSAGIGRTTAEVLARRGRHVIATARQLDALAGLPVAQSLALDVRDDRSVAAVLGETGPIDALVNNAGVAVRGPVESVPPEEVQRLFDSNVFGTLRMIRADAPAMRQRVSGRIVNISSALGRVALPLTGVYSASKWALEGLSEALRLELQHFGISVAIIEPGTVDTGAFEASTAYLPDDRSYQPLADQLTGAGGVVSTSRDVALAVAAARRGSRRSLPDSGRRRSDAAPRRPELDGRRALLGDAPADAAAELVKPSDPTRLQPQMAVEMCRWALGSPLAQVADS